MPSPMFGNQHQQQQVRVFKTRLFLILVILHKIFLAAGSLYTTNTAEACKIGPSFAPGVISNATGRFLFFYFFCFDLLCEKNNFLGFVFHFFCFELLREKNDFLYD